MIAIRTKSAHFVNLIWRSLQPEEAKSGRLCCAFSCQETAVGRYGLEKLATILLGNAPLSIEQIRLEADIGFATDDEASKNAEDLAQMLLPYCGADGSGGGPGDGGDLAPPDVLLGRLRSPVEGVLQNGWDGAIVLGCDQKKCIVSSDFLVEAFYLRRPLALEVIVEGRSSI